MAAPGGTGRGPRRGRGSADLTEQIRQTREDIRAQVRATRVQFDEANARITARTGRNLLLAIVVGLLLGGGFIVSLVVLKQLFVLVAAALVGFAVYELAGALRTAGRHVPRIASTVAGVLAQPVAYLATVPVGGAGQCSGDCSAAARIGTAVPLGWLLAVVGAIVVAVLWRLVQHVVRPVPGTGLRQDLGATVFVQLYVTLLGTCVTVLTAQDGGQWWTLSFVSVVVATDVFAYASGLAFGKHPMAPRISPKKTWEGFAGSALAAVVVGTLLSVLLLRQPLWFGPVFGLVILGTGTLGDLTESLIKRDIGIKDISGWLPGHGGFLDRIDSVLPSGAAALSLLLLTR
jgi:phosphatidate cytidylyltransferase